MGKVNLIAIKIVLILGGLFITLSGLNIALGGMLTLGWGGPNNFFTVTDMHSYLIQDSHVRFVGGIWLGIGLLFLFSTTNLQKYQHLLRFSFVLIFLGGLMRLTQMHFEITFCLPIVGSLIGELFGMPLLYVWISKTLKQIRAAP